MASYSFTFTVVVSQLKNMSNPAVKLHFVRDCVSKTERHGISLVVPLIPCVHKMRHCGKPGCYCIILFLRSSHTGTLADGALR